ncbi:hypothetical protein CHELA1G11_14154 [Hyphomicrobiales bacterium]|nr:hypothetical protein CHELA1G2_10160 [Hyphomicrobiales bacterium]CAH1676606.1 hypothetical protein CHELA1G11_14154 [Hyphomicrobiales bacterium]
MNDRHRHRPGPTPDLQMGRKRPAVSRLGRGRFGLGHGRVSGDLSEQVGSLELVEVVPVGTQYGR